MGPPSSLWGVQSSCLGLLRPLLRPVSHPVAGAAEVCYFVRMPGSFCSLENPDCVERLASSSATFARGYKVDSDETGVPEMFQLPAVCFWFHVMIHTFALTNTRSNTRWFANIDVICKGGLSDPYYS